MRSAPVSDFGERHRTLGYRFGFAKVRRGIYQGGRGERDPRNLVEMIGRASLRFRRGQLDEWTQLESARYG